MTPASHFQIILAKIKAVSEISLSGQHIPIFVWRAGTNLESPVIKVHVQRWASCSVWNKGSTSKRGWSRNKSGWRMWGITYFTLNPCWKDVASVPKLSLESAWKLHISLFVESWTVFYCPWCENASQINTFPLHWRKTIKPQQSCWFLLALSSVTGYSSYPCQSH